MRPRTSVETVCVPGCIHNGSKSRDSVPLWKKERPVMRFRTSVETVCVPGCIHNGSISCDSVPLRFK